MASGAAASSCTSTVRILRSAPDWDATREHWNALHARCDGASAVLEFDWLRAWWSHYQHAFAWAELCIITAWRSGELMAALPLYRRRESAWPGAPVHLAFISTGEHESEETCAEYLGLLHHPADRDIAARLSWQAIAQQAWDHLELLDVRGDTGLLDARCMPKEVRAVPRGHCPVADLSTGFESYLQRLSANARQQARRMIRAAERAGARLECATPDTHEAMFTELVALHQQRWNQTDQPGAFAAPRFVAFHRQLIAQWHPRQRAVLARVRADGRTLAVLYGFITGGKFDFYQSGVGLGQSGALRSPGRLAHLLLMRHLAAQGVQAYDFLRGASAYKLSLANAAGCELIGMQAWRPTWRAGLARGLALAARALRAVRRHAQAWVAQVGGRAWATATWRKAHQSAGQNGPGSMNWTRACARADRQCGPCT